MDRTTETAVTDAVLDVVAETNRAIKNHGLFHSAHEAYGVLAEEVEEFWAEVRKKHRVRSKSQMRAELIQVAAVAIKAAAGISTPRDRSKSSCSK